MHPLHMLFYWSLYRHKIAED